MQQDSASNESIIALDKQESIIALDKQESIIALDKQYEENVAPYETIVKTIGMHNNQVYCLHEKYVKLHQQHQDLRNTVQETAQDQQRKKERERQLRKERNRFIEQAITVREKDFNEQYKSQRYQRLEQITLKYKILPLQQSPNSFNIFFNLEQGLLEEVIQDMGQNGGEQVKKQLGMWLTSYNNSMNDGKLV